MQTDETKAIENYHNGNYPAALRAFLRLEAEGVNREDIFVYIANSYDGVGNKTDAVKYYKKILKINPKSDVACANLAIIYYELGQKFFVWRYAHKALKINQANVQALTVLGNIYHCKKAYQQALRYYQKAIYYQRDFYAANFNIAGICFELKDYATAYFYAKKTIASRPDSAEAKELLAQVCTELGKYEEAKEILLNLYVNNPKDYWLCNMLSQAYQHNREYDKALETGYLAISLSRGDDAQQINFGYLLYEIAMEDESAPTKEYAKKWLDTYPDNPIAKHMANAIVNAGQVKQLDSVFVREIFDVFADDFEDVLKGLDYSVPSLMSGYLDSLAKNTKLKKMRILDAGCGTGLCGRYLKKHAAFMGLDGVDISEKMLLAAKAKKLYNRLYNQEVVKFLQSRKSTYDLINAADVFTYFGDMSDLFLSLYGSLKKGGRILFSISENSINDKDYFLHVSGRFVHKKEYIERLLSQHGFEVENINRARLRNEGESAVYGWIVMAVKNLSD